MSIKTQSQLDDTISLEDAACGYKGLMVIEHCFRSLKRTQIKLTPMYHWASRRIESHVKICVLAVLIERITELECVRSGHHYSEGAGNALDHRIFGFKIPCAHSQMTTDMLTIRLK